MKRLVIHPIILRGPSKCLSLQLLVLLQPTSSLCTIRSSSRITRTSLSEISTSTVSSYSLASPNLLCNNVSRDLAASNEVITCQTRSLFTTTCTLGNQTSNVVNNEYTSGVYGSNASHNNNNTNDNKTQNDINNISALDVAIQVNKIKRLHQTGGSSASKKQLELDAWNLLNALTDEQINMAEGKAVSLLLNSWAYFAKYWENGKDGPATNKPKAEEMISKLANKST